MSVITRKTEVQYYKVSTTEPRYLFKADIDVCQSSLQSLLLLSLLDTSREMTIGNCEALNTEFKMSSYNFSICLELQKYFGNDKTR